MTDKKHENNIKSNAFKANTQPPRPPTDVRAQAPEEPAKPGPVERESGGAVNQARERPGAGGPGGGGQIPPTGGAAQPPRKKGGRGLAILALLIALVAAGGSGYLWYLWYEAQQAQPDWPAQLDTRLEQVMGEVAEQREATLEDLQNRLQTLQEEVNEALNNEVQALKNDIQSLRDSAQAYRGDAQTLRTQLSHLENALQDLEDQLNNHVQEQQQTITRLDNRIENLQLGQRGLVNTLEAVKGLAARGGDVNALPLSEIEYLLRLAHHKLEFQQDVEGALNALKIANRRLEAVGEDVFNTVQRMIREDIATLSGVELPDISALAHKIVEMEQRVDELPIRIDMQMANLKEKVAPTEGGEAETAVESEAPWWERAADAAWRQFKDIVIIRHERTGGPPLIAPEEEYFLRQNLRLELEAVRLALLRGAATNYQESIETARNWIKAYFDTAEEPVQDFLNELQGLQRTQLHPYIPDISDTLQVFREVMERREPVRSVISTTGQAGSEPAQEPETPAEDEPAQEPEMPAEDEPAQEPETSAEGEGGGTQTEEAQP